MPVLSAVVPDAALPSLSRFDFPTALVVTQGGRVLACAGAVDEVFPFASVTKPLVAWSALVAVDRGLLRLEDPATQQAIDAAIAERGGEALDVDGLSALMFTGANDRHEDGVPATAWVALDEGVVADHAVDPFNNFGAPMTLRFAKSFCELYRRCNGPVWARSVPRDLPVLIIAGDQDPVANYGEGAYALANDLWSAGLRDVRTRVWTGVRHEIHNEPTTRAEVEAEILAFVGRVALAG